eukprot:CAMPEP_0181353034 /NCGR_PEP_ID=MMETSP1106-20121128/2623_1 /TAXON_ID=81844 /ORGANISM="Mantoniella antarctica, Strain SL-175" /LENGTH=65 /DNA_ID=CAMNT_0023465625 /DNA_START=34 /DNA_END=232 /DNA_ORIENTATION=+
MMVGVLVRSEEVAEQYRGPPEKVEFDRVRPDERENERGKNLPETASGFDDLETRRAKSGCVTKRV